MLPKIPVKITATTVMGTIPPCPSEMLTAIGVVTDLGIREAVIASSRENRRHIRYTLPMEARDQQIAPTPTGIQFSFSRAALV